LGKFAEIQIFLVFYLVWSWIC